MKIGCCFGYNNHDAILLGKKAGFEFIEVAVTSFASATEEDVADFARFLHENEVECPGANCLFTDDIRLTGENADFGAADAYLNRMLEKLRPIGLKHVVFGSGRVRSVPEGFSKEAATEQLVVYCRDHLAPIMEKFGLICGVEELFKPACNILNTCRETMEVVRRVDHPRIRLLVDMFHMGMENEDYATLADYPGMISHVHISSPKLKGEFPRPDDGEDYPLFFASLRSAGYPEDGLVSIEGHPNAADGLEVSSERAYRLLKAL